MSPTAEDRAAALVRAGLTRPRSPFPSLPARLLLVDVERQRLHVIESGSSVADYSISTAADGVGGEAGSLRTPPGWHRIQSRIGNSKPLGAVFQSRRANGDIWRGEARNEDLVLTRILTLEGLEEGVNRGPGCDSMERCIYIHGTNHERSLGRPASHGCVRMANTDVVALFDLVAEGDPVVIVEGGFVSVGTDA